MTDRKALADTNNTPEDVATLYTWANLHGAKYRDFSASRAQSREKARQRVQEAIEEERRRVSEQAKAEEAAEAQRAVDSVHAAEAERLAEIAAQTAARLSELTATYAKPPNSPQPVAPVQQRGNPGFAPPENDQPAFLHPHSTPVTEDSFFQPSDPWTSPESQDNPGSLAWFVPGHCETGGQPLAHVQPRQASEDALLEPSHRLTPRWFALKSVFEGTFPPVETAKALAPASSRAPVLAVFSLAGGVGKTSLVATLGRALSARGEKVLLVDTAAYGLLPLFFGARDQRPGVLRTFTPPGASGEAPIQMVTIDPEALGPEAVNQETLTNEIGK